MTISGIVVASSSCPSGLVGRLVPSDQFGMGFGIDLVGVVFPGHAFWAGENMEQGCDVKVWIVTLKEIGSLRTRP